MLHLPDFNSCHLMELWELGTSMRAPKGEISKRAGFTNFSPATAPSSGFRFPVYRNGTRSQASLVQVETEDHDGCPGISVRAPYGENI